METPTTSDAKSKRVVAPLTPVRRQQTEHANLEHSVTVDYGVKIEDILKPDFWGLVAPEFTQYDKVRVRTDDGSYYAELLVLACDSRSARMEVLLFHDLDEKATAAPDEPILPLTHEVRWRGPHNKFCVIRKADGALLRTGLKREDAVAWLTDYLKAGERKAA